MVGVKRDGRRGGVGLSSPDYISVEISVSVLEYSSLHHFRVGMRGLTYI